MIIYFLFSEINTDAKSLSILSSIGTKVICSLAISRSSLFDVKSKMRLFISSFSTSFDISINVPPTNAETSLDFASA